MNRFIAFLLIGLMLISGASAANSIASTQAGSTAATEITSSTYVDIASNNVSIATSDGELYVQVFTDSRTNYSKKYGSVRIKIDGVEIESMNLSAFTSYTPDSFMAHKTVTEGTHYAEIEVKAYSGKKLYLRSWNMTVIFLKTGSYVSTISNASINPYSVNASNLTGTINYSVISALPQANVSGLVADLNSLQLNDTTHDSDIVAIQANETAYVTNETVQAYSMDAGNLTEIINYSVIPSLPQANVTNLVSDLSGKEATVSEGIASQFYAWNKTWQNITTTWITEGNNLFYTTGRAISALSGINSAQNSSISGLQVNDTADRTYVNNTFLPISTYSGDYPNASLSNYLLIATYSGDFPNSTVAGNLEAWNATQNDTYETHLTSDGSDHTFIDQDVTSGSSPTFNGTNIVGFITNATVNINVSNATGTLDKARIDSDIARDSELHSENHNINGSTHTGSLTWAKIINVQLDLANNVTGVLGEANIDSDIARDSEVTVLTDDINSSLTAINTTKANKTDPGYLNKPITFVVGGNSLSTGLQYPVFRMPVAATIERVDVYLGGLGNITLDIYENTTANYVNGLPNSGDSIFTITCTNVRYCLNTSISESVPANGTLMVNITSSTVNNASINIGGEV